MENVKDIWSFKSQTDQEKYKTDQMGNFSMKMATTEEKAFSLKYHCNLHLKVNM